MVTRAFTNIISEDIEKTADFFRKILGYRYEFVSDWFIHLASEHSEGLELGVLDISQEIIPKQLHKNFGSCILTFVVPDVEESYQKIKNLGLEVIEPPQNLFYGQRRLLVLEPVSKAMLDISSECSPSK